MRSWLLNSGHSARIAELFIKRPVMTVLVMLAILLFGWMGNRALPVSSSNLLQSGGGG